ncbi:MAG: sugar phosphate isomerase/epimerase [Rhodobacteraceae bacterium]|nr:sugar phosphate isomerase/epimerase [Paracoccaceae bacterium]
MVRKIGCCTWIFGDQPLANIALAIQQAGLDGVELFGDWRSSDAKEVKIILDDHGLEVFSITPADADISNPDAKLRSAALDYYKGLADFTSALGAPMFCMHGQVGRIRPVFSQEEEDAHLSEATIQICTMAASHSLNVAFEILNRYESHQIRTVAEGLALLNIVGVDNLSLLADAYHMNIEEASPAAALLEGGSSIGLYHAADSNRCAVGEGHTHFASQFAALDEIQYSGPIILETAVPGPDPFNTDKGAGFRDVLNRQLITSKKELRALSTRNSA